MSAVFGNGQRYWGKAISQSFGGSSEKKTPQFSITFDIIGAIDTKNPGGELLSCPSGTRTVFWYLTQGTMPYVLADLEAMGYDKDSLAYLDPTNPNHHNFVEMERELYCQHEQYQGKPKEKWGLGKSRTGIEAKPLEDKELRKLDAMFSVGLKKLAGGKKAAPPTELAKAAAAANAVAADAINAELAEIEELGDDGMPF